MRTGGRKSTRSPCDLVDFLVATPCDHHGIMIKFSNCEEGKLSMVKLLRFAKIRENRKSFPPRMF